MTREREKVIESLFRRYKENKKELAQDYSIPVPSSVSYDKIAVKTDHSKNPVEGMTVEYIAKREDLFKRVWIVDEVLNWFRLEGHGRERFIKYLLIEGHSWTSTELECRLSRNTLCLWRREVFEKAEMVGIWVNFFKKN